MIEIKILILQLFHAIATVHRNSATYRDLCNAHLVPRSEQGYSATLVRNTLQQIELLWRPARSSAPRNEAHLLY